MLPWADCLAFGWRTEAREDQIEASQAEGTAGFCFGAEPRERSGQAVANPQISATWHRQV